MPTNVDGRPASQVWRPWSGRTVSCLPLVRCANIMLLVATPVAAPEFHCGTRKSWCLSGGRIQVAGPEERCTIGLWQGYVSALFYARPVEQHVAMLLSPTFRTRRLPWRRRVPLCDDPAAEEALRALEEMLATRGWEKTRPVPGADWYELQFRRNGHTNAHRAQSSAARSNGAASRGRRAHQPERRVGPIPKASTTSSYQGARELAAPSVAASEAGRPRPGDRRRASRE